nr:MAG TPA: helix-turn-helix domain protein [Bacteriophage sp.]
MTFGEKIKTARISKHYTQRQLAELINAKHNSISDWEKDKSKPDMDTVELICGALDLSPGYLMDSIKTSAPSPELSDTYTELIELYSKLSEDSQKAIMQILRNLK